MSDAQHMIGKIIPEGVAVDRDAIHVAIIPVILQDKRDYESTRPGDRLKLVAGTKNTVRKVVSYDDVGHGIVDPFLVLPDGRYGLKNGDRFYMWLNPNSVTGMRHHWQHPLFDGEEKRNEHEIWIRDFADEWGFDYDQLVQIAAVGHDHSGRDWITAVGRDCHGAEDIDNLTEFWSHLEALTGRTFDDEHRERVTWSCSC